MPGSRKTHGLAAVTLTAPTATTIAANNYAAHPIEVPSPSSSSKQAMGALDALGCPKFQKVCVCVCVSLRVFNFSDASYKSFGLIFKFSIRA